VVWCYPYLSPTGRSNPIFETYPNHSRYPRMVQIWCQLVNRVMDEQLPRRTDGQTDRHDGLHKPWLGLKTGNPRANRFKRRDKIK